MKYKKLFWLLQTYLERPFWQSIGAWTYVGRPALIARRGRISLGKKVRIFPGARLECGPNGTITIRDNVSIGPNLNITAYNSVVIAEGVTISANVFITDMDHDFSNPHLSVMEQPNIISEVFVGSYSFIGANAVILAGTKLGQSVVVGANSTVRGEIAERSVIVGNPAKIIANR